MVDSLQQSILLAITLAAFFLTDFSFIVRYDRERTSRSWKPRYWLISLLFAALLALQPLVAPWLGLRVAAPWGIWIRAAGVLLVILSLGLQIWARLHLGRFYAERADIQPGHQLISTGPYAYVRHPLFSSYFLFVLGLILISPNLLMLAGVLYTFVDFTQAAKRDEQIMLNNVPGYADYMARIPRFVPRLTSHSTPSPRETSH